MRYLILIFSFSLLSCCLLLGLTLSEESVFNEIKIPPTQRVLGASEVLAGLKSFPQAETVKAREETEIIEEELPLPPQTRNEAAEPGHVNGMAAVFDVASEQIIFARKSKELVPIASITKLATALVFLEQNPGWDSLVTFRSNDQVAGGRFYLNIGDTVTVRDLFKLSLIGSANSATRALVRSTGMTEPEFVEAMNEKMYKLGLSSTGFVDPLGFGSGNISTAEEVARLAHLAFLEQDIREAAGIDFYEFRTQEGGVRSVRSTNQLLFKSLGEGLEIIAGKTGYTKSAGYCLVAMFRDKSDHEIVATVLGTDSPSERFNVNEKLAEWIFSSYEWDQVL